MSGRFPTRALTLWRPWPWVITRVVDVLSASDDPWFFGPYGWALADVTPIRTVTAKGAMGLWPMSDVMRELVFERWNEARVTP